ncbi:hypothetical protein EXU57_02590 [Segetibacter sp. 3557_3]|uniref:hypothetical protein n=1 Tax=Segetibacter sp. 3557_3 TaxID=2547429 RepID=UPI001058534F|nr:hypothetical protein [Segetibacter sp. 3557_3]TDH28981.1 hypothetical protein EXU57_02590 [Segetibacter sp. 3557_3]
MKCCILVLTLLLIGSKAVVAQNDPEFPKGFIMHLKLHDGLSGKFDSSPELFIGGIQAVPQVTVVENLLRAGLVADGFYTNKKLDGAFGPTISVKLKTLGAGIFGSAGNLQLSVDHLWGLSHQRLAGLGFAADLGNLIMLGVSAHRDYHFDNWWIQSQLGIRISKKKKITEPFNQ